MLINPHKYLQYLLDRYESNGGTFEVREVSHIDEVLMRPLRSSMNIAHIEGVQLRCSRQLHWTWVADTRRRRGYECVPCARPDDAHSS